ncbi:MAG: hypothetical protein K2M87_03225 [Muribaculaceae bacterium]|nr:hypothetical protein [Muribaculaceae bacterium]
MTKKEKNMIKKCRVIIWGTNDFYAIICGELYKIGFRNVISINRSNTLERGDADIIINEIGIVNINSHENIGIPIICPLDLIRGAAVIVFYPGDDYGLLNKENSRIRLAEYISGYCAFWNVESSDWLNDAMPAIRSGKRSYKAARTAAIMCARIIANIAISREVKHYPRFYIYGNSESG